jgi:asparagine synthase (glutamine-hydrolysing)
MCGIVAISSSPAQHFEMEPVLDTIRHRGPDGSGVFISEQADCHLGHVRLAILDLSSAGHQPMADGTSRYQICYNGEIYNFRNLQAGLVQRHGAIIWKSGTDTEIIVEGFAREGVSFLNRLNGIFALAIYDTQERLLHVLRDPLGIKPLFITEQNQGVFFCSELKGLLAFPNLKRTLRRESLADQIAFMFVPEPHTMYNEFRKVEPSICFSYRDGKQVAAHRLFTHLNEPMKMSSEMEAIECLQSVFAIAVQRQLVADVPVSLFLSGGLDSSAVAQQAVQYGASIKDAYTIAFSEADRKLDAQSDDLHYARLMANRLGVDLRVIEAKVDFIKLLPELMNFMEDGFTDPAAINTYLISAGARRAGVKVMLSGQGADEYLGGYRRYQAEGLLRRFPVSVRSVLAFSGQIVSRRLPQRFNATRRRLARFADLASQSTQSRQLGMHIWTAPDTIRELLPTSPFWTGDAEFGTLLDTYADDDIIAAMMKTDQHYDLLSLNLCYTDRMSMAVGVEARVPFLDFDLVRVMNAIPVGLKLKGWQGKYILKKAMEPLLPKEVIYREKAGFGLPIRSWLNTSSEMVSCYLDNERIKRQGIFSPSIVRKIIAEQREGRADHSYTIFTLLCQQIWLEANHINC